MAHEYIPLNGRFTIRDGKAPALPDRTLAFIMGKKLIIFIASLFVFFLCFTIFILQRNDLVEYSIGERVVGRFLAKNRNVIRVGETSVLLRLSKAEGLHLLANIIDANPKQGDSMKVKFSGRLISDVKNQKSIKDFSSVLSSAFPPAVVSVWFSDSTALELAIKKYNWHVEKRFFIQPKDLHPSSSMEAIIQLHSSIEADKYLYDEREKVFLQLLGYSDDELNLKEEDKLYFQNILTHKSRRENSEGVAMPLIGTWIE